MASTEHASILEPLDAALIQQECSTQIFGRTLHILAATTSTNDVAKQLALQGAPEGTVVLAEQQTQGRGRQGRSFASPPGVGIYLSLLLRPQLDLSRLPQLTLITAVAVAEAITATSALSVTLKWPNDVEIRGRKTAGILTEAFMSTEVLPVVIVGIGINVNTVLAQLPVALQPRVTSLAIAAGHPVSRHRLIASLLEHLERFYQAFPTTGMAPILQRWLHYGPIVGHHVRFTQANTTEVGIVQGLDDDGALLVQDPTGVVHRIFSGEVLFDEATKKR